MGIRTVSQVLTLMRQILGRKNANDPESNDATLLGYLNDFVSLTMSDDVKLFEQFGTYELTIDETTTDGVYDFNDGASPEFVNTLNEAMISILDPVNNSLSWNPLLIYYDPQQFYNYWGINNEETLVRGYPTEVLFYGYQLIFRTLPEQSYIVNLYGYKKNANYEDEETNIQYDFWLRYLAYGAAYNYALDFRYEGESLQRIKMGYQRERKLQLTHTHNHNRNSRCQPRF